MNFICCKTAFLVTLALEIDVRSFSFLLSSPTMLRPTLHTRFCPPFLYKAFTRRDEEAASSIGWALYTEDDDDSEANTRTPSCWPPYAQGLLEQDWCKSTPALFVFVLVQFLHQLLVSELLKNPALPYTGWFRRKGIDRCQKNSSYKHVSNSEWLPR